MVTYQDFLNADNQAAFIQQAIGKHKASKDYMDACVADDYFRKKNRTIMQFQKILYTVTGKAIPDNISADYKLRSTFFYRFVIGQNQYLLGNGITWQNEDTEAKLGNNFDYMVEDAGEKALIHKVSFGFWNFDHLEVFSLLEFVPLWDEEDGGLKGGIRFWQIAANKPMRATLYELDGYTDYIWKQGETPSILREKRSYIQLAVSSPADGEQIYNYTNYDGFPIVPLWGNKEHQSELEGIREQIDCYDLIKSGFANTVDEASYVYWAIQNAGGMDDIDLANFIERMRTVHASIVEADGAKAEAHSVDVPYESREALLTRLRTDLYDDFMALDTKQIANGADTATAIRAGYEDKNSKTDRYEYCVTNFITGILKLAGIDDKPSYTRSVIVNRQEEVDMVVSIAPYVTRDYLVKKLLTILGDADMVDEVLNNITEEDMGV